MTGAGTALPRRRTPGAGVIPLVLRHWPLWIGVLLMVVPTMTSIARITWSTEQGAHGPIVLATGLWLLARSWNEVRAVSRPGNLGIALALAIPCLILYALARITNILEVEGFALYGVMLCAFYAYCGSRAMRAVWFLLIYFLFLFPPPDTVVAAVTQPLKLAISSAAVALLDLLGYPIARVGVMIRVEQYDILVAAACAGLNSLISLSAISLFYVYIRHNANWRYALLLMLAIVPVAILANFVRVLLLILITYHFGDAAAQGFLHGFAGLTMFVVALLGIFGVDALAAPLRGRLARAGQG